MNYIYTLSDPRDNAVRYVGQSNNPQHRYNQHIWQPGKFRKGDWIRELKELGLNPSLGIIWECERENVDLWERVWIAMYRETGSNLLNSTNGGQSIHSKPDACKAIAEANSMRVISEETRKRMSVSRKGKKHSEETKRKIGLAHKGRAISNELRARISKTLSGRVPVRSKSWRENVSKMLAARNKTEKMRAISVRNGKANKGRKQNREEIDKRIAARAWYRHSDDAKKKIAESNKRRVFTDEMRKKMSERSKKWWAEHPEMRVAVSKRKQVKR